MVVGTLGIKKTVGGEISKWSYTFADSIYTHFSRTVLCFIVYVQCFGVNFVVYFSQKETGAGVKNRRFKGRSEKKGVTCAVQIQSLRYKVA